jgi:Zn-dependent protease with chaperone function
VELYGAKPTLSNRGTARRCIPERSRGGITIFTALRLATLAASILVGFSALHSALAVHSDLRFHYFVDLLAGVGVALVGWWIAQKYSPD